MIPILILNRQRLVREIWVDFLSSRADLSLVGDTGDPEEACRIAVACKPQIVVVAMDLIQTMSLKQLASLHRYCPGAGMVLLGTDFPPAVRQQLAALGIRAWLSKNSSLEELPVAILKAYAGVMHITPALLTESGGPSGDAGYGAMYRLTDREYQVADFLCSGKTSKEVAAVLNVSYKTVEACRHRILKKLACKNTVQLADKLFKWAYL